MHRMAPEAISDAKYSVKTDAFSYGVILYEIVTRDEPWAGESACKKSHLKFH